MAAVPPPLIGWPLLPVPDAAGHMHFPDLATSVREQIEVILRTARGEQLMRPEYGAALAEFLHEPNTLGTRQRLHDRIAEALAAWEPRIAVDRIDLEPLAAEPSTLRVQIAYRLQRTNHAGTSALTIRIGSA